MILNSCNSFLALSNIFSICFALLTFSSFAGYQKSKYFPTIEHRVNQYLIHQQLDKEAKQIKKQAVFKMFQSLDFTEPTLKDTAILDYAIWYYQKESEMILNEKIFNFQLTYLIHAMLQTPPTISTTHFYGATPLGGWGAHMSNTTPSYGILKFIGQYTNDRNAFDQCVTAIQSLDGKIKG